MLKRLFESLFGDVPARFPSEFSLSESVVRLRERTKRTVFASLHRQAAVGRVTESTVRLQRVIPFFGNSFKPVFVGEFRESQGRVTLEGRFTMVRFAKIFMTVWLALALLWTALAAFAAVRAAVAGTLAEQPMILLFPIIGVAFLLGGVGFVRFGWWLSRNDIRFLTSVIERALSNERGSPIEPTR